MSSTTLVRVPFLVCCVLFPVLIGCGGKPGDSPKTTSTESLKDPTGAVPSATEGPRPVPGATPKTGPAAPATDAAEATFRNDDPAKVLNYLEKLGLQITREYSESSPDNFFTFVSKEFGTASKIDFEVSGKDAKHISNLSLRLVISNKDELAAGMKELLPAAELLTEKATGKTLPAEVKKAISEGTFGDWKVGWAKLSHIRTPIGDRTVYLLEIK